MPLNGKCCTYKVDWTKNSGQNGNWLSNRDITTSLPQACVQYQSYFLDPIFGSIVKALSHPL
jgi:hypothetical protein